MSEFYKPLDGKKQLQEMMNDTPRTDANDLGWQFNEQYGDFDSLSDTPMPWLDFSKMLERELTAAREELDEKEDCIDNWMEEAMRFKKQRDRLVEALRKAISWGDSASHHILHRQDMNWTYLNEAKEALQSLNQDHFPDAGNMIGTTITEP